MASDSALSVATEITFTAWTANDIFAQSLSGLATRGVMNGFNVNIRSWASQIPPSPEFFGTKNVGHNTVSWLVDSIALGTLWKRFEHLEGFGKHQHLRSAT